MEWRLFADLAETAGTRCVAVDAGEPSTVGEALERLFDAEPALREAVLVDGSLADHITVLHNGRNVEGEADGLTTPVEPGDELALFPPVSGG